MGLRRSKNNQTDDEGCHGQRFTRTPAFLKIKSRYSALRTAEKKVADYILQHGEEVTEMTVTEVRKQPGQRRDGGQILPENRV